jgi:hypothetical protein
MANWYKELKEINEKDSIILITVETLSRNNDFDNSKILHRSGNLEDVQEIIDYDFSDSYGGEEGFSFTAWSKDKVYFPVCYDGAEWISWVPRNPCDIATTHQGGG